VRSYNQYCAVAKALDVVGDRWTLLIARELLIGPCRYGELQQSLPGMASNLLASRLRNLEGAGVVVRDAESRYVLTPWGEHLAEPVQALARWGAPLMSVRKEGDAFRSQWLAAAVGVIFGGVDPGRPPFVAEIRADGAPVTMESSQGRVQFRSGPASAPNLVLSGPPDAIIGLLAGRLNQDEAEALGVSILGDLHPLAEMRRADWLTGPEICQVESTS